MKPNAKITAGSDFDFETWELQLFKPLTAADPSGEIAAAFNAVEAKMLATGAVDSIALEPLWRSIVRNISPYDLEKMRAALVLAMLAVGHAQNAAHDEAHV